MGLVGLFAGKILFGSFEVLQVFFVLCYFFTYTYYKAGAVNSAFKELFFFFFTELRQLFSKLFQALRVLRHIQRLCYIPGPLKEERNVRYTCVYKFNRFFRLKISSGFIRFIEFFFKRTQGARRFFYRLFCALKYVLYPRIFLQFIQPGKRRLLPFQQLEYFFSLFYSFFQFLFRLRASLGQYSLVFFQAGAFQLYARFVLLGVCFSVFVPGLGGLYGLIELPSCASVEKAFELSFFFCFLYAFLCFPDLLFPVPYLPAEFLIRFGFLFGCLCCLRRFEGLPEHLFRRAREEVPCCRKSVCNGLPCLHVFLARVLALGSDHSHCRHSRRRTQHRKSHRRHKELLQSLSKYLGVARLPGEPVQTCFGQAKLYIHYYSGLFKSPFLSFTQKPFGDLRNRVIDLCPCIEFSIGRPVRERLYQ